jgi:antagonist of KipI
MSSLLVESPGLLTTVPDSGREGYAPQGISPSGAADPVALRLGNLLVGNQPGAAALEMTLMGGCFAFPEGGVIALTGSDFCTTMQGRPLEMWTPHAVPPGGKLVMGTSQSGARCYLSVAGGILVPSFLGSASTHLLCGLGGHEGRALRSGDVLETGAVTKTIRQRRIAVRTLETLRPRKNLRVTPGPQANWFSELTRRAFYDSLFQVGEHSDRQGLRLEGPVLARQDPRELISEGVSLGAIQVTPSGHPIILFVEQQTTGGYPKIANIIGADLHGVGQLRPRDQIRFELISLQEARAAWISQQQLLTSEEQLFA